MKNSSDRVKKESPAVARFSWMKQSGYVRDAGDAVAAAMQRCTASIPGAEERTRELLMYRAKRRKSTGLCDRALPPPLLPGGGSVSGGSRLPTAAATAGAPASNLYVGTGEISMHTEGNCAQLHRADALFLPRLRLTGRGDILRENATCVHACHWALGVSCKPKECGDSAKPHGLNINRGNGVRDLKLHQNWIGLKN